MTVINAQDAQSMGITSMPRHISSSESGEKKGVACRKGAGGLLFWFELIKLSTGEFRTRDRHELLGKSVEEVRSL
tara:strand:- start:209 stop:433 length:225 start_codon:yes stop_codon:yes gene_type:complete